MADNEGTTGRQPLAGLLLALSLIGCAGKVTNVTDDDGSGGTGGGGTIGEGGRATIPLDPKWDCATLESEPDPTPVDVTFRLVSLLGFAPVVGSAIELCARVDAACDHPLAEAESDADGTFVLHVPGAFSGFVSIVSDADAPTLYFFHPRELVAGREIKIQILKPELIQSLSTILQSSQKDGNALVMASVVDCHDEVASGLELESDLQQTSEAVLFYAVQGVPSKGATATDESGIAGLVNVPPGSHEIRAILPRNERTVSRGSFLTRPNSVSVLRLRPGL